MKRKILLIFLLFISLNIFSNDNIDYIEKFENNLEGISFDVKFDKYYDEDMQHFVYINNNSNIRELPTTKSKIVKKIRKGSKLPVIALVKDLYNDDKWYEIKDEDNRYYIHSKIVIKREFNWEKAVERARKINEFIELSNMDNLDIYYINSYVSLDTETTGKKDKFGNPANQSIKAYDDKGDYINLPDRTLVNIVGEKEEYILIKTLSYGDEIYKVSKKDRRKIRKTNIVSNINKFIFIDRKSQNQITIERDPLTDIYNINTVAYVTTGITKGVGFVTPYGDFLVAFTKPVMLYADDYEKEEIFDENGNKIGEKPIIIGDANFAIRFSGGGYLHGIPSTYGDNREERKKNTESKLGTIELSHKCVRHADDVIEYVYKWVNGNNKRNKNGHTYPEENVMVIVE